VADHPLHTHREEYANPLHNGRLLFAGEGTNIAHPACVDGAYETGTRAAAEAAKALGAANGGGHRV
jgi:monoamine oxidase